MIIVRAPYRVSLFGGGSDYPSFIDKYGYGVAVSFAIDKHCYVNVKKLLPFHKYSSRVTYDKIERVIDNGHIHHPIVRNCIEFAGLQNESLEINHISDIVGGCGLATSSTMIVTLWEALKYLMCDRGSWDAYTRFRNCAYIEQKLMNEPVGYQDYLPAINGNSNKYEIDNDAIRIFPLGRKFNEVVEKYGLLFYTGVSRNSSTIINKYIGKIAGSVEQLQIRDLAERAYREIRGECCWEELADMLNVSWGLKQRISPDICSGELGKKICYLYDAGAAGLKLLGGGGGGSVFVLASEASHYNIVETAKEIGMTHIPFRVAERGVTRIL